MDQGGAILADDSEVERQVNEIERLGRVEQRVATGEEEELHNKEETGYEMFPLAETSVYIRWSARRLTSVSAARGEQRIGGKAKGKSG